MSKMDMLMQRMKEAGFTTSFVRRCLPDWWDEQSEESDTAWLQLQIDLAQRFSIEPLTLLDESRPLQFSDTGRARFKRLQLSRTDELAATGFAKGLARLLLQATEASTAILPSSALDLRRVLLEATGAPWLGFPEIMQLCATVSIPVAHLTAFPTGLKGMSAMTCGLGDRAAIFIARQPIHPSQTAFHILHEFGHIALGHVQDGGLLIESLTLDPQEAPDNVLDEDEAKADAFAFELLTGTPDFLVSGPTTKGTARELSQTALQTGHQLRIDPGLIVLCFGHNTQRWRTAASALKRLPDYTQDTPKIVNRALRSQLNSEFLSSEDIAYLDEVTSQ